MDLHEKLQRFFDGVPRWFLALLLAIMCGFMVFGAMQLTPFEMQTYY